MWRENSKEQGSSSLGRARGQSKWGNGPSWGQAWPVVKSAVGKVGCVLPLGLRLSIFAQAANYERTFQKRGSKIPWGLRTQHSNVQAQNKIKLLAFLLNFLPVLSEFVHI